jgi:hypothetical protein
MDHQGQAALEQDQDQIESDASTISCPPSPVITKAAHEQTAEELGVTDELASIQEELQTVLEYVDHGMLLKSFDTLSRLTDIVVTNCEKLGKLARPLSKLSRTLMAYQKTWLSNFFIFFALSLTGRSSLGWRWCGC